MPSPWQGAALAPASRLTGLGRDSLLSAPQLRASEGAALTPGTGGEARAGGAAWAQAAEGRFCLRGPVRGHTAGSARTHGDTGERGCWGGLRLLSRVTLRVWSNACSWDRKTGRPRLGSGPGGARALAGGRPRAVGASPVPPSRASGLGAAASFSLASRPERCSGHRVGLAAVGECAFLGCGDGAGASHTGPCLQRRGARLPGRDALSRCGAPPAGLPRGARAPSCRQAGFQPLFRAQILVTSSATASPSPP